MEEKNQENLDSVTQEAEEETADNDTSTEERFSALEKELAKQREIADNQRLRAEKAEAKAKAVPKPTETKQDLPDVDERILKANGMPDELLKELKVIAKARNISLIDAQNDNLFVLVKKNFEEETKLKEASLDASKGSGNARAKVTPSTPGLSREDHKRLYKEMVK